MSEAIEWAQHPQLFEGDNPVLPGGDEVIVSAVETEPADAPLTTFNEIR
ncbi:hypothetical protein [Microbacterium lacticum]